MLQSRRRLASLCYSPSPFLLRKAKALAAGTGLGFLHIGRGKMHICHGGQAANSVQTQSEKQRGGRRDQFDRRPAEKHFSGSFDSAHGSREGGCKTCFSTGEEVCQQRPKTSSFKLKRRMKKSRKNAYVSSDQLDFYGLFDDLLELPKFLFSPLSCSSTKAIKPSRENPRLQSLGRKALNASLSFKNERHTCLKRTV